MTRVFVGVDGETIHDRYCLFGAGPDALSRWRRGIALPDVLDWLARRRLGARFVAFAFHYDVCMMVRDLRDSLVLALMESRPARIGHWLVQYYPRRILRATCDRLYGGGLVEIFDTWGFFQCSFEEALRRFSIPAPRVIQWGKAQRAHFQERDLPRIRRYNRAECELLARMCGKLEASMARVGLRVRSWHGPGALADAYLKEHGVREEMRRPPPGLRGPLERAYFGGRIETLKLGHFRGVTLLDQNSSYPAALLHLWDQADAKSKWRHTARYHPDPVSLWRVEWDCPDAYVGPLPWRAESGRIFFPRRGRGWYWFPEVEAALRLHGRGVRVRGGYHAPGAAPSRLAALLPALYEKRRQERLAGRAVEAHVLKLTMNSLYGKMAQSIGSAPWQAPDWAGYVTSFGRAQLRAASSGVEARVISFATDGLQLLPGPGRPGVTLGDGLGEWKESDGWTGWVLGSGIYRFQRGTEVREAFRGLGPLDWPEVIRQVQLEGFAEVRDTRFITPQLAILHPKVYGPFRARWKEEVRHLAPWLEKNPKRHYQHKTIRSWFRDWCDSEPQAGWPQESWPFEVEWKDATRLDPKFRDDLLLHPDDT